MTDALPSLGTIQGFIYIVNYPRTVSDFFWRKAIQRCFCSISIAAYLTVL